MSAPGAKLQSEYFDRVQYRDPFHPVVTAYAEPKLNFIRSHIPLSGRILDVGCGNGIFTKRFAPDCSLVVGLDAAAQLLTRNPHPVRIRGDATALPFQAGQYDVV